MKALADVSLTLQARAASGRCFGENGAGKSTLVKCIMGTYRPDGGLVKVGEHTVELKNPRQAHALGVGMVYQHFTLVENMTVVENMVMAREHVPAIINWKTRSRRTRRVHGQDAVSASIRRRSSATWPPAKSRRSRLLKQLYLKRKVIILDEPTSVLTPQEADEVLGMVPANVHRRPAERADDHPQVPRSDGLLRRSLRACGKAG